MARDTETPDSPTDSDTYNNAFRRVFTERLPEQGATAQLKERGRRKPPRKLRETPKAGAFKDLPISFVSDVRNFLATTERQ